MDSLFSSLWLAFNVSTAVWKRWVSRRTIPDLLSWGKYHAHWQWKKLKLQIRFKSSFMLEKTLLRIVCWATKVFPGICSCKKSQQELSDDINVWCINLESLGPFLPLLFWNRNNLVLRAINGTIGPVCRSKLGMKLTFRSTVHQKPFAKGRLRCRPLYGKGDKLGTDLVTNYAMDGGTLLLYDFLYCLHITWAWQKPQQYIREISSWYYYCLLDSRYKLCIL